MEEHYKHAWVILKRPWTRQGEPPGSNKTIYNDFIDSALRINTQPYPFNPKPFKKDF